MDFGTSDVPCIDDVVEAGSGGQNWTRWGRGSGGMGVGSAQCSGPTSDGSGAAAGSLLAVPGAAGARTN
jgi:hypothetical protein